MKLGNPAILITGGAKRIGLEIARHSIALGYDIVIQYRCGKTDADEWLARNPALRKRVAFIRKNDLSADPASVVLSARAVSDRLIGLVNNASEFRPGSLMDSPSFDRMLRINTLAPLELSRAFARNVRTGWIVNLTDANITRPVIKYQNYRISKLMLTELTLQMAVLWGPRIRVNAIAPGAVLPAAGENRRMLARLRKSSPLRQGGTVADLLAAYEYLLKTAVTGQIMYADGGMHCL